MIKIPKQKICYIEGLKDYVKIYLEEQNAPLVSLVSLKALTAKLDPRHFMRIHRSYIISLDKISAVTRAPLQLTINTLK